MPQNPADAPTPPLDFTDPATGLLYNLLGARSQSHLDRLEHDFSISRFTELRHPKRNALPAAIPRPVLPAVFNEDYARHLHAYLFQDVYPWAGETRADRSFQGQKEAPGRSGYFMSYTHHRRIGTDLAAVSQQLSQENNLRGLAQEQFVQRAAYYMDHFNHIHAFREGNGRTVQALFFELGRQAGYKVDLTPDFREFNPARDEALVGYSPNRFNNIGRLEGLLRRFVKPLPGKEAEVARHPSQARPLPAPTPEVARLEALRELKASSQAVSLRLNSIRPPEQQHVLFINLQRNIMAQPEAIARLAPALHRQAEEATQAPATLSNGPVQLVRFERAIDQTANLFAGQQLQQPLPVTNGQRLAALTQKPAAIVEVVHQKTTLPPRRRPKL